MAAAQKVKSFCERWQWFITMGVVLIGALGFDVITPDKQMGTLRAQQSADSAAFNIFRERTEARIDTLGDIVRALGRGECLDRSERERQLMNLPCHRLLPPEVR
jgi:hypothetical protein